MNRPNDTGPADPNNHMSRADYARNVRQAMEERRQKAIANRQHYQPIIHEQIQRLFQNYEPPFYASIRGFGKAQTLGLAEATVLALAAGNDRRFSDSETQALAEHFLTGVHNTMIWKWGMTGYAGYMTYKGSNTFRFPFFTPQFKGRFSPAGGPPAVRMFWHLFRFSAYYGAAWVIAEPLFQSLNFMRQRTAMVNDPRLQSIMKTKAIDGDGDPFATAASSSESWGDQGSYSQPQASSNSNGDAQGSWSNNGRQQSYPQQQQQPQRQQQQQPQSQQSDAWSSSIADDFDDASPVAVSSRNDTTSYSGSAWDRVRQQSNTNRQPQRPRQDSQSQQSWGQAAQGNQWGNPEEASPQDKWSGSQEKYDSKDQAQRQFDEMLDKERRGVDEKKSWSNK